MAAARSFGGCASMPQRMACRPVPVATCQPVPVQRTGVRPGFQAGRPKMQLPEAKEHARRMVAQLAVALTNEAAQPMVQAAQTTLSTFASMMDTEEEDEDRREVIEVDATQMDESLKVINLGLSPSTVAALQTRGITSLFPIQKVVLQPAMDGRDLIARAKTGSGKTLAFALPVVEALIKEDRQTPPRRGRGPRCIVLAPTRELANQVAREFATVCPGSGVRVEAVYGGTAIMNQMRSLDAGCDVVVGTPGRVMDLMERGSLRLEGVRYAILDEADLMLDMGFEEDMERILASVPRERQTMLFSATLPHWVEKVAKRFQKNPLRIDLIGEEQTGRLADTIRLLATQVDWQLKTSALMDAVQLYANAGKAIVFVNTKARADEVCEAVNRSQPCVVLHGDISQAQRERSLQLFRDGRFRVLVATDVAARGLDIPSVDLVVHYDVPNDSETFLHRSGRTGRAGKSGTAMVLFTEREMRDVGQILKNTKVENAELVGARDPTEVMTQCARSALSQLDKVHTEVIEFFVPAAEKLLASPQPARVMAAALASMSGFRTVPKSRSLLTYQDGFATLRMMGKPGMIDSYQSLCRHLKQLLSRSGARLSDDPERLVGRIKVVEDKEQQLEGVAFDVPSEQAKAILSLAPAAEAAGMTLDVPRSLALDVREMLVGRDGRGGAPRGDRWGNGGGYGFGAGRGSGGYGSFARGRTDWGRGAGYGGQDASRGAPSFSRPVGGGGYRDNEWGRDQRGEANRSRAPASRDTMDSRDGEETYFEAPRRMAPSGGGGGGNKTAAQARLWQQWSGQQGAQ